MLFSKYNAIIISDATTFLTLFDFDFQRRKFRPDLLGEFYMKHTAVALAVLATILITPAANAGFTVDEGAPRQTALTAMQIAPPPVQTQEISMDVAFVPRHSWMAIAGKNSLKESLEEIKQTDEVRITTYPLRPASPAVQKLRGNTIKQWLTSNGIALSKITVIESQEAYSEDPSSNTATLTLVQRKPQPTPQYSAPAQYASAPQLRPSRSYQQEQQQIMPAAYQPAVRVMEVEPRSAQLINDKVRLTLIQKIISMAQNKLVKPEDAVNMLAEILKMQEGTTTPTALSPATASVVAVDLPRTWTLDNKKTLRENVEEWARVAKWEAPDWRSTTTFEFPYATLNGTFLDVLGQLAKAVPALDFNANRSTRSLTVVDAGK